MSILWTSVELPTVAVLQQALHTNVVKETELLHRPQDIIYTDGSKREMHTFGTNYRIRCVQAGSYCSAATQGAPDRAGHAEHH